MTTTGPRRRFEILREIAAGGFGSVLVAKLVQPDGFSRIVAVKLLHPQWCENEEVASRMRDEARLLGLLRHRNIVDVLDLTRIDGRVAIIMEYLEAVDGKSILEQMADTGEALPKAVSLQICAQLSSALDAAYNKAPYEGHRPLRVIHRDIKPSNVMIDPSGVVKVLDFGVARADFDEREARTQGMAFGSFDYMPPERRFMEPGGETSDVYSVAALLFEFLVGEKIGKGKLKPAEHQAWVDERVHVASEHMGDAIRDELVPLMASMLAFDAEDRPRPARVTTSFRKLARKAGDEPLDEWAERAIPPLLAAYRSATSTEANSPLVGKLIAEDTFGLDPAGDDRLDALDSLDTDPGVQLPAAETEWVDQVQPSDGAVGALRPHTSGSASQGDAVGSMSARTANTNSPASPRSVGIGAVSAAATPAPAGPRTAGNAPSLAGPGATQATTGASSMPGPAQTQAVSNPTMHVTKDARVTEGPSGLSTAVYFLVSVASWGLLVLGLISVLGAAVLLANQ